MTEFRPVWAEIDLDAVRANVRALRRDVGAGAGARGREGRRLRARRGTGRARRARSRRDRSRRRARRRRHRAARRRASTRRSSCCRSRFRPRRERGRAPPHAGRVHAHRHRRAGQGRGRSRCARPARRAPQGRHRDAPRRVPRRRRGRARGAGGRPARSCGSPVCARTSPSPTSPTIRTPPSSSPLRRGARRDLGARGLPTGIVHAANTAGAIDWPAARYDMVRVGIGIYGIAPADALDGRVALRPALVGEGARLAREDRRRGRAALLRAALRDARGRRASRPCRSVTPTACRASCRTAAARCSCAAGGARWPGTVTMDQLMVDVGDSPVEVGDEVVLIGRQGDEEITAADVGARHGHDRVHDRVRHRPRVPRIYPASGAMREPR